MQQDTRWQQHFASYKKAFAQLDKAIQTQNQTVLERAGIIQMFEFTSEPAWNTRKDNLLNQGINDITVSRDAIRKAFKHGLLQDGINWMKMQESRTQTSHIYNEDVADTILTDVVQIYHPLFKDLFQILESKQTCLSKSKLTG
jgi:nucleotidyltransferase substrate binding protein (TIGR01987 family)